jgi:hypothetical protein
MFFFERDFLEFDNDKSKLLSQLQESNCYHD